jgi:hypothetical protein
MQCVRSFLKSRAATLSSSLPRQENFQEPPQAHPYSYHPSYLIDFQFQRSVVSVFKHSMLVCLSLS